MPFCHSLKSYVLEMVSIRRSKATRKEETNRVATIGQKKKSQFEGEVHQNQKTSEPYTCFSLKKQPQIKTTRKVVLMYQFDDYEERDFVKKAKKT